jgi:hypothetical protein
MLAAFLKDPSGAFDIAGLAVSVVGACMISVTALWFLPRAIRTGRIPYGFSNQYWSSTTYWLEREKHPVWFWILFALYSLMIPLGIVVISVGLFAWTRKDN